MRHMNAQVSSVLRQHAVPSWSSAQDVWARKLAGAAVDVPPEFANARAQLASGTWALDSGASRVVVIGSCTEFRRPALQHIASLQI